MSIDTPNPNGVALQRQINTEKWLFEMWLSSPGHYNCMDNVYTQHNTDSY